MPTYEVGQKVIMRTPGYRGPSTDTEVEIIRVGRKYVYVTKHGREVPFSIETGYESSDGNYKSRLGTAEDFAVLDQWNAARQRLRTLTAAYGWMNHLPAETMTQIADLIEEKH